MILEWTIGSMPECFSPSSLPRRLLHIHQGPAQGLPPPGSLPDPHVQAHIMLFVPGFQLPRGTLVSMFRAQGMAVDTPELQSWPRLHDSGPVTPLLLSSSPLLSGNNDSTSIMGLLGEAREMLGRKGLGL